MLNIVRATGAVSDGIQHTSSGISSVVTVVVVEVEAIHSIIRYHGWHKPAQNSDLASWSAA